MHLYTSVCLHCQRDDHVMNVMTYNLFTSSYRTTTPRRRPEKPTTGGGRRPSKKGAFGVGSVIFGVDGRWMAGRCQGVNKLLIFLGCETTFGSELSEQFVAT